MRVATFTQLHFTANPATDPAAASTFQPATLGQQTVQNIIESINEPYNKVNPDT